MVILEWRYKLQKHGGQLVAHYVVKHTKSGGCEALCGHAGKNMKGTGLLIKDGIRKCYFCKRAHTQLMREKGNK